MSAIVLWLLVGLGFGAVATRRPTAAAVMVSAQTLLVGVAALAMAPGRSTGFAVAGALLLAKALMVSAIVAIVIVVAIVVVIVEANAVPHHAVASVLSLRLGFLPIAAHVPLSVLERPHAVPAQPREGVGGTLRGSSPRWRTELGDQAGQFRLRNGPRDATRAGAGQATESQEDEQRLVG